MKIYRNSYVISYKYLAKDTQVYAILHMIGSLKIKWIISKELAWINVYNRLAFTVLRKDVVTIVGDI